MLLAKSILSGPSNNNPSSQSASYAMPVVPSPSQQPVPPSSMTPWSSSPGSALPSPASGASTSLPLARTNHSCPSQLCHWLCQSCRTHGLHSLYTLLAFPLNIDNYHGQGSRHTNFPGLSTKLVLKYPPQSVAVIKEGHLDQAHKNKKSTKPSTQPSKPHSDSDRH